MKNIKLGICLLDDDENVLSKRLIKDNWSVNDEQDLKINNPFIIKEISTILVEDLKMNLTPEIVEEMLKRIGN